MAKLDHIVLEKLAKGYLTGELKLNTQELSQAVIFVIVSNQRRKTAEYGAVKTAFGNPGKVKEIEFYAGKLFDGLIDKNQKATELFWKLFNATNNKILQERLEESINEAVAELSA